MLNYANLNDMEFEALCKDIMERKLGVSLRRFGPGRDHGVDLTDDVSTKSIVVQVKHYRNSTTDQLVRSLKNELPKVIEFAPQQYYICCSRELSADNIKALYQHFQAYMASDRHIVTLIEIDDFLKQEDNKDILKKHFKLWLDDTGLLEDIFGNSLFIDCEVLLDDIEEQQKLFVQTRAFDQALRALESRQILCIVGNPGVGKTITSKMLVLHYAALGYQVRYTSDVSDLGTLKNSISRDPDKKEIILLDDCFGQAYFEMHSEQSTALIHLIKYVKRHPKKVLILNSRVTIFQEAQQRQQELARSLDRDDFKIFLLDINNLSDVEKAKIFYNHLSFSEIPDEYLAEIRSNQRYKSIVSHRNYSPRIIEFVCSPRRYRTIAPQHFCDFMMKHLDNPREMWADEYDNRLEQVDRILLQTIYSLTATWIDVETVRHCFHHRIEGIASIDKTNDPFGRSLRRLNSGFVKIVDQKGVQGLSVYNPSVNDFITARLWNNPAVRSELIRSICCIYQLRILPKDDRIPYIVNLLQTGKINDFYFTLPEDKTATIGQTILASGLCMEQYRTEFQKFLLYRNCSPYITYSLLPTIKDMTAYMSKSDLWDTYKIAELFSESDNFFDFLFGEDPYYAIGIICAWDCFFEGEEREEYLSQAESYLSSLIEHRCEVDVSGYSPGAFVESAVRFAYDHHGYFNINLAVNALDEAYREMEYAELQQILAVLPEDLQYLRKDLAKSDISIFGSEELIQEYLTNPPGHHESDDDKDNENGGYSPIDAIFER